MISVHRITLYVFCTTCIIFVHMACTLNFIQNSHLYLSQLFVHLSVRMAVPVHHLVYVPVQLDGRIAGVLQVCMHIILCVCNYI